MLFRQKLGELIFLQILFICLYLTLCFQGDILIFQNLRMLLKVSCENLTIYIQDSLTERGKGEKKEEN